MRIIYNQNGEPFDVERAVHDLALNYAQIKLYEAIRKNEYGGDPFNNYENPNKFPPKEVWEVEHLFDDYCSAYGWLSNFSDSAWLSNIFFEEPPCD